MFNTIITVTLNPAIDRAIEVTPLEIGAHARCRTISRIAGGKGVNVSRVLAEMGVTSLASGFLGSENRSVFDNIFSQGVIKDAFVDVYGLTRENLTLVDAKSGAEMHLRDAGLAVEQGEINELVSRLHGLAIPGNLVIFCGSLPPGVKIDDFLRLVDVCIYSGAKVAVDASGEALRAVADKKLWLLKPNAAELAELAGKEFHDYAEMLAVARPMTHNIENILVSCGGDGAYLVRRDEVMRCRPGMNINVVNTVGCGDTLLGAFVGGLCCGADIRGALMHAVACAGACAANPQTAKFEEELVDEILEHVIVENAAV